MEGLHSIRVIEHVSLYFTSKITNCSVEHLNQETTFLTYWEEHSSGLETEPSKEHQQIRDRKIEGKHKPSFFTILTKETQFRTPTEKCVFFLSLWRNLVYKEATIIQRVHKPRLIWGEGLEGELASEGTERLGGVQITPFH